MDFDVLKEVQSGLRRDSGCHGTFQKIENNEICKVTLCHLLLEL